MGIGAFGCIRDLEQIPQKLKDFCERNLVRRSGLARFLSVVRFRASESALGRIPKKLTDFFDQNSLQLVELARFPVDRTISCDRKARQGDGNALANLMVSRNRRAGRDGSRSSAMQYLHTMVRVADLTRAL
ncbi:MAG TPA: hypothetical protein VED87_09035, partial [Methylocystis sp.]|nr:hypothetical protein [Methylocystis sp.]